MSFQDPIECHIFVTHDTTLAVGIQEWKCDADSIARTAQEVWSSNTTHIERPYGSETDAHWLLRSLAAVIVKRPHL